MEMSAFDVPVGEIVSAAIDPPTAEIAAAQASTEMATKAAALDVPVGEIVSAAIEPPAAEIAAAQASTELATKAAASGFTDIKVPTFDFESISWENRYDAYTQWGYIDWLNSFLIYTENVLESYWSWTLEYTPDTKKELTMSIGKNLARAATLIFIVRQFLWANDRLEDSILHEKINNFLELLFSLT